MFMTSSYSSNLFLIPKLFSSTLFWALSIDFVIILCWMTSPSLWPILSIALAIRSDWNKRIKLSSSETKNCEDPGSPCLPALPLNCLSTLLDSCLSVPMMARPPAAFTSSLILISVPRPAMLVAIVTLPGCPASATTCASLACCLAFNTLCWMPLNFNILLNISEISTEVVPTRIGRPSWLSLVISSITALYFSLAVLNTKSSISFLVIGLLVGITDTSNL